MALQSIENNSDRPRKRKSQSPEDSEANGPKRRKRGRPRSSEIQQPQTPITDSNPGISPSGDDRGVNPNVVTRKRKSILQPSGGKYSKKAAGRRKGPPAMTSANDSQEASDQDLAADDSPLTTLRNAKDLELLTNPSTDRFTPDPDHPPSPKFLPRKYLELKVVSYDVPSPDPQGPGDLWTCTFEGCYHRVHEASTAAGKKRIKEHFKTHATQAQEKIDLVLDESRPYLPVKWVPFHSCCIIIDNRETRC